MLFIVAAAIRFTAALLLLYAAAQKFTAPGSFRQTLTALRMPLPKLFSVLVPVTEIAASAGLVAMPNSLIISGLVAGLGCSFAGAATVALVRKQNIRCACYGQSGDAKLGIRQLIAAPVWLGGAVASYYLPDGGMSGPQYIAVTGLTLALFVMARSFWQPALRNRSYLRVLETQ